MNSRACYRLLVVSQFVLALPNFSNPANAAIEGGFPLGVPDTQLASAGEARAQFERGNYREAERAYLAILKAVPDNFFVLHNLGLTQFRLQKFTIAELNLRKALVIDPENISCLSTLGLICFHQKKFDDALQLLTRVLIADPANPTAQEYLSLIAAKNKTVANGGKPAALGSNSAANTFLAGHLAFVKAEKFRKNGALDDAAKSYREVEDALSRLVREFPNWNTALVQHRRKVIAEALLKLQR
jgi:tetratricopeptide (TPR) repeat protein